MKTSGKAINMGATILLGIIFLMAMSQQVQKAFYWGHESWCITEWLINYQGGFVRRGLPGQIIFILSDISGIRGDVVAITFSLLALLFLMVFFLRNSKGRLPVALIFSPLLLGCPVFGEFIVRKDSLCIVGLIGCILVEKTRLPELSKTLLINFIGVAMVLSHEGFIFVAFTSIIAMRFLSTNTGLIRCLINFSPMVGAFLVSSYFHGTESTAIAINNSLLNLWHNINPNDISIGNPSCAIDSLKYNLTNCPWMGYTVFWEKSNHIYAWFATIVLSIVYLLGMVHPNSTDQVSNHSILAAERTRLFLILVFQLASISPLFVIGVDYGRWIFLWINSSLVIYLIGLNWERSVLSNIMTWAEFPARLMRVPWEPRSWHLLFFGIPGCLWSVNHFLQTTPIGNQLNHFYRIYFQKSLFPPW
jgi:hypothetical protein